MTNKRMEREKALQEKREITISRKTPKFPDSYFSNFLNACNDKNISFKERKKEMNTTSEKDLQTRKADALKRYKLAKLNYLSNPTTKNWHAICDRKNDCMRLGVRI